MTYTTASTQARRIELRSYIDNFGTPEDSKQQGELDAYKEELALLSEAPIPRSTDASDVSNKLFEYLASEGFVLTEARKGEIIARLQGHPTPMARAVYDSKARTQLVFLLMLEDCTSTGTKLSKTLEFMPLYGSQIRSEAETLARQAAIMQGRPTVVCDANYENVCIVEGQPAQPMEYAIYESVGDLIDADAPFLKAGKFSEDYSLLDAGYLSILDAAGFANEKFATMAAIAGSEPKAVVVVNQDTNEILYRLVW